jgi:hypothetical protein
LPTEQERQEIFRLVATGPAAAACEKPPMIAGNPGCRSAAFNL